MDSPSHSFEGDDRAYSSAAATIVAEGVGVTSLENIHEPIDPRISLSSRSSVGQLDTSLAQQFTDLVRHHPSESLPTVVEKRLSSTFDLQDDEPIYARLVLDSHIAGKLTCLQVDFKDGDERNPANFSRRKKWVITLHACFFTLLACELDFVSRNPLIKTTYSVNGFRIQPGLPFYDARFELHRISSNHRIECLRARVWRCPSRDSVFQRRIWPVSLIYRLWNWVCYNVCDGWAVCDRLKV